MKIMFTRIAEQELEDSVRYYELEYSGLGRMFKDEVRKAVEKDCSLSNSMVGRARGDKKMSAPQVSI